MSDPVGVTAEGLVKAQADVIGRLRALLAEGAALHEQAGQFCIRGVLEDGTPCPSCDWSRRAKEAAR